VMVSMFCRLAEDVSVWWQKACMYSHFSVAEHMPSALGKKSTQLASVQGLHHFWRVYSRVPLPLRATVNWLHGWLKRFWA